MHKLPKGVSLHFAASVEGGVTIYLKKSIGMRIKHFLTKGDSSAFVVDAFGAPLSFNKVDNIGRTVESYYHMCCYGNTRGAGDIVFEHHATLDELINKDVCQLRSVSVRKYESNNLSVCVGHIDLSDALEYIEVNDVEAVWNIA